MRRRTYLAGAAAAVGTLAGCAGVSGSGSTPEYDVGMTASAFEPREYQIDVGEAVTWRNTSSRAHTVTAYEESLPEGVPFFASGGFDSESAAREGYANGLEGAISPGETYEVTFEVAGSIEYFCIPHERAGMVGRIVVG